MTPSRQIRWSALTCRLRETDIYLGLAASLDDVVSDLVSARQMVTYPLQQILLTMSDAVTTPLRVYAVRDPSIVTVTPCADAASEPGFERVWLDLNLQRARLALEAGTRSAAEEKAIVAEASAPRVGARPVMAFLLTIGMPVAEEDQFFRTVVSDFITKSWMTFPSLLRGLGCASATEVVEGDCTSCAE